jgi:putative tryptophan/tyrosine transport system substrate-binding protein
MTKRRVFFCLLATFFLTTVSIAEAQHLGKIPQIGFLSPRARSSENEEAFRRGLRELGYVEGENIRIEWRFAGAKTDILPRLAAELVGLKIEVIVVGGRQAASAAKYATKTIPIVMAAAGDPVATKLVASLAHPGENVTGLSIDAPGLNGKRLELLKESFPKLSRVAVLYQSIVPGWNNNMAEIQRSALLLKIQLQPVGVISEDPHQLETAFSSMIQERSEAFIKLPAAELPSYRKQIVYLAAKNRLPAIYDDKQIAEAGGLMSYGTDVSNLYHRASTYVDKILKGTKPADLPVEQPMKFELVINLKAAKQIGLTIPPNVLVRADKVIR